MMRGPTKISTRQINRPISQASRGTNQSIATSTYTTILFADEEYSKFQDHYNPATGKFTCPLDGKYLVSSQGFILDPGSAKTMYHRIMVDANVHGLAQVARSRFVNADANHEQSLRVVAFIDLEAGDDIYIDAWHNHGSDRSFYGGLSYSDFSVVYLGK